MVNDILHTIIAGARFEIDGQTIDGRTSAWKLQSQQELEYGVTQWVYLAKLESLADMDVEITAQQASGEPAAPVRFCYRLTSRQKHAMTKSAGEDYLVYLSLPLQSSATIEEIRLGEFPEVTHTYTPMFDDATDRLRDGLGVNGPIVIVRAENTVPVLLAYEHGVQDPDAFLQFAIVDHQLVLRAVKGNYLAGQRLDVCGGFESPWFHLANPHDAAGYRRFMLKHQSGNQESRKPYIFYNTWNYQERIQAWHGKKYLDEMNQDRIMREIDVAAKMGIDVFVIDTGWYQKTGDWQVNRQRFPDGLKSIKQQLDGHGMKLGLWFDNAAAVSSQMLAAHRDCVQRAGPEEPKPWPVWETEESLRLCPVSRWWSAFADEMVRLHKEVGVTYFKLDAISQSFKSIGIKHVYACLAATHDHGGAEHSEKERAERFGYLLPIYMAKIAERVRASVPDAIVDFDMTEGRRCFGLAFLSASKFFLINNGPYYQNYQVPVPKGYNSNLFFYPGPARNALCRSTAGFDKIFPLTALLAHYFPDGPAEYQLDSAVSLMLGHGGIWGDLCALDADGVALLGKWLGLYKHVRDDVVNAYPMQTGKPSGSPEIHEKISGNGRGLVAIFAQFPGRYEYVTKNPVAAIFTAMEGITVMRRPDGRAFITAEFHEKQTARAVLFGI